MPELVAAAVGIDVDIGTAAHVLLFGEARDVVGGGAHPAVVHRDRGGVAGEGDRQPARGLEAAESGLDHRLDRKSTRLNSSHVANSYAVFCLQKKERISGLRRETRQKLAVIRPPSLGHAAQVSGITPVDVSRSEEHTSELQSPCNLV